MSTTDNHNDDDGRYDYHEHPHDDDYPGGHNHVTTHDGHGAHHHDRNGSVIYYNDRTSAPIVRSPVDVDPESDRPHRPPDNPPDGGTSTTRNRHRL
jgi:hypothetical protein